MHRKGIPSLILANFIPLINFEVNSYISDLFDFYVEFELEDSDLNIYFVYDKEGKVIKRNVIQTCGQEGTIVNLAIRAALSKLSLLPKLSMLLLDEAFSMLDKNNKEKTYDFMCRLKPQFESIFIISHEDEVKEWVEDNIELRSENGITSIVN
jgi:DNA repair exonuclease SbcCD ATPase subunit